LKNEKTESFGTLVEWKEAAITPPPNETVSTGISKVSHAVTKEEQIRRDKLLAHVPLSHVLEELEFSDDEDSEGKTITK